MTEQHDGTGPRPSTRFGGISQQQEAVKQEYRTLGRKTEPVVEAPVRSSVQAPGHLDTQALERKRQTVYLSPALIRRIKHYVADSGEEISEVAEQALTDFLDARGG